MISEKRKKSETTVKTLNLLDARQTWFLSNGSEYNVREAPPEVFDVWIRQHVEEIVNVDTARWEIYDRWFIINACIEEDVLYLRPMGDGNQSLEEKSSDGGSEVEVDSEAFSSEMSSELESYNWPEPA